MSRTDMNGGLDDALDDAAELRDEISRIADDLKDTVPDAMSQGLRRVEAALAGLYDNLAAGSNKSVEVIGETVEDHPWAALFASFAAGILVGHLLSRGR